MAIEMKLLGPGAAVAQLAPARSSRTASALVVRFDEHQRLQHALMMSTFIILALTGLPQKFSDLTVSRWWVDALGGLQVVRAIHRTAGLIMLSDCLYHLTYLVYRIGVQGQRGPLGMLPGPKDVRDVAQTICYFLGLVPEKPKFDRFSYLEKFDYWAVFWGIVMIGGSGLVLLFPLMAIRELPGQAIPLAITIHSDEAILAVGWILIVHMFNVHLAPRVFPFNPAIFTGKLTVHRCAEDHPLEWERISAGQVALASGVGVTRASRAPFSIGRSRAGRLSVAATRAIRLRYRDLRVRWSRGRDEP